jgi:streptogramin lyase
VQQAQVYLLQVNTSGYGSANLSKSLLKLTADTHSGGINGDDYVLTNSTGGFNIGSGDYTCTSGTQVYLYSVGGTSGFGTNSAAGLMSVLGQCGSNNSFTGLPSTIEMNEITTVAAAYALAGFATDAIHISGSNTTAAATAMQIAAATAASIGNLGNGRAVSTTAGGNGTVPESEINTLADILASCINSSGPTSGGCSTLFSNAKSSGSTGTAPTDTATAAINIAHNPSANVSNLFALATATSPFQSILTSAPNDWTISISYTATSLNGPSMVAIDASGNVWVTNSDNKTINEFSPFGAVKFTSPTGSGGLNQPFGIAVDASGNIWVSNVGGTGNGSISEFSSTGTAKSPSGGYTGGGLFNPWGLAIDGSGHVWVANLGGSSFSEFSSTGSAMSGSSGFTGGGLNDPLGIAVDHNGNIWAVNTGNGTATSMSEYTPGTGFQSPDPAGFSGGGLKGPVAIGIDKSGNVWGGNEFNNALTGYNSGSGFLSTTGFTGGGLNRSDGLAVDGASHIWIANFNGNSISEFSSSGSALSGSNGFQGNLSGPQGVAVDGAGNVWVVSDGGDTLNQFVGAATPVVFPLVQGVINNTLGTPP